MYTSPIEVKLSEHFSVLETVEFDKEQYEQGWNDRDSQIVRCKDCKNYIPCQKLPIGTSKWCDLFDRATCEMNYCGWGERRVKE